MSYSGGDVDFRWGAKSVFQEDSNSQYYESFTYKGLEYFLYDCVYLLHANEMETSIGKIVGMWETRRKEKKLKIVWFFRPKDIINVLDFSPRWNQLFLACGEGDGLYDVIDAEMVLGKCNVICSSCDKRNTPASNQDVKEADYFFSSAFDVGSRKVSTSFPDAIANVKMGSFFNKNKQRVNATGPNLKKTAHESCFTKGDYEKKAGNTDSHFAAPSKASPKGKGILRKQGHTEAVNLHLRDKSSNDGDRSPRALKHTRKLPPSPSVCQPPAKRRLTDHFLHSDQEDKTQRSTPQKPKQGSYLGGEDMRMPALPGTNQGHQHVSLPVYPLKDRERNAQDASGTSIVNRELSSEAHIVQSKEADCIQQLEVEAVNIQLHNNSAADRDRSPRTLEHTDVLPPSKSALDQPSRKRRYIDHYVHSDEEDVSPRSTLQKSKQGPTNVPVPANSGDKGRTMQALQRKNLGCTHVSVPVCPQNDYNEKSQDACDATIMNRDLSFETDRMGSRKATCIQRLGQVEDKLTKSIAIEVEKGPTANVQKWFLDGPWEYRLQSSYEEGRLLFFTNLDPSYTSCEVEDIMWTAFKVKADAMIIPRVAYSSPHYGQAYVEFRKQDVADRIMLQLKRKVLMIVEGRPLVASKKQPIKPNSSRGFLGHLAINDPRLKRSEAQAHVLPKRLNSETSDKGLMENHNAVSTSHPAQHNTIEHDFAVEWQTLQLKSDFKWKRLHEEQEKEISQLQEKLRHGATTK